MKVPDPPQTSDPLAARLRTDAAELRRSPAPDFTARVRRALVSAPPRASSSGLQPRVWLPVLLAAALLLTLGFATWSNSGARDVTSGMRGGPRVVRVAHPRAWGTFLRDSFSAGVAGRLESELDGVMGDVGQVARALVARIPSGLRRR